MCSNLHNYEHIFLFFVLCVVVVAFVFLTEKMVGCTVVAFFFFFFRILTNGNKQCFCDLSFLLQNYQVVSVIVFSPNLRH